jgi:hypothetical protein
VRLTDLAATTARRSFWRAFPRLTPGPTAVELNLLGARTLTGHPTAASERGSEDRSSLAVEISLVQAAWPRDHSAPDKASTTFLVKAIEGNFAEVQMGELAQKNGQSPGVKSFGQMLQTDHSAANEKAMDAAKEAVLISAPDDSTP